MRSFQHIIDTSAVKQTLNSIHNHWVVRELTERDYGIDLMLEIFKFIGNDKNGHPQYDATGRICYLQIKGTNSEVPPSDDGYVSFQLDKKALLYVDKFPTPFILVRACILKDKEVTYFVWLQRYIRDILDNEVPDWRDDKQESYAIRIPIHNTMPEKLEKIDRIAAKAKYIEEAAEFYERYSLMEGGFNEILKGDFSSKEFESFIKELKRISTFSSLLELNTCQVNKEDIIGLINYIEEIYQGKKKPSSINDFGEKLLFDLNMLSGDNFMRSAMEEIFAGIEGDTVY